MSTQPMKPKTPTMWERYSNRPAMRPTDMQERNLEDIRAMANTNANILQNILEMLTDHAAAIDALKHELRQTKEFMDWATTTHEGLLSEFHAVQDVVAATGSDAKLSKLLDEWRGE